MTAGVISEASYRMMIISRKTYDGLLDEDWEEKEEK